MCVTAQNEKGTLSATPTFKIIACVMYGLASSLRCNICFLVYLAEKVISIYIIFALESKWMPWSGKGLGLWGCKDSVRHFITSQIGQPATSRHLRHAFQNLHLVFQCFPLKQWMVRNGWLQSCPGSFPRTRVCWPWSSDSCGVSLTVAVNWCNTWYVGNTCSSPASRTQTPQVAGSSRRLGFHQGKKIEILNPTSIHSSVCLPWLKEIEFHNAPQCSSILYLFCCHAAVVTRRIWSCSS